MMANLEEPFSIEKNSVGISSFRVKSANTSKFHKAPNTLQQITTSHRQEDLLVQSG